MRGKQVLNLLFLLALGCSRLTTNGKAPVTVEGVSIEEKQRVLKLSATLEPSEKVEFKFPLDVKIEKVFVALGESVQQGDPLFSLSETDFNLHLNRLRGQLMEQEALLEKNVYFLRNRDRLLDEGKIDQTMHDTLEMEVKTLEAQVQKFKSEIGLAENYLSRTTISAPFSGQIGSKNISSGTILSASQTALTLVQMNPIHVTFQIPLKEMGTVAKGMSLQVFLESEKSIPRIATLFYIAPEAQGPQPEITLKATLPNENLSLKGGASAEVQFKSSKLSRVLRVPTHSILTEGGKEFIYIVRENRAWPVRIFTSPTEDPDWTEVVGGIKETDLIITQGYEKLKTGQEVNLWR